MRLQYRGFDRAGLIEFDCDGAVVRNPFELALQATVGGTAALDYLRPAPDLVPRLFPLRFLPDPREDAAARAAMDWLLAHEVALGSRPDASVWHYDFEWNFRGEPIPAPWVSAFAQAYVVFAGLCWFRHDGDPAHLALAERAARGMCAPIRDGGTAHELAPGAVVFEEIPGAQPTHIFNAHLVALLALCELAAVSSDRAFHAAWQAGLRGYEALADQFDTGFWSTYDCAPAVEAVFQLCPDRDGIGVGKVTLRTGKRTVRLDLGDDAVFAPGPVRAAGIDWGPIVADRGRRLRTLRHGPTLHAEPVPTGTRQNTYLYLGDALGADGELHLEIEVSGPGGSSIGLGIRAAPEGLWRELPQRLVIGKDGTARVRIAPQVLRTPVGLAYHRYHILLLQELARASGHAPFAAAAERLLARQDAYRAELLAPKAAPPRLTRVYWSVNSACGLACKMCDFGVGNREASLYKALRPTEEKTVLAADLVIRRCLEARPDLEVVHFIGTEPLFHPDIPRMVREIKAGGIKVIVTTNGLRLDRMLAPVLAAGVDELWISIDGPPPVHDEIRGHAGLFDIIAKALRAERDALAAAKARGFRLCISCAISPLNHDVLADMVRATADLPFDLYWLTHLNYITPEIAAAHNARHGQYRIAPSTVTVPEMETSRVNPFVLYRALREAEREAIALGRSFESVPALDFLGVIEHYARPERPVGKPHCQAPSSCLEIASDGSASVMARCYQMALGNIHRQPLREIFAGGALSGFRAFLAQEGIQPPCLRCCGIM